MNKMPHMVALLALVTICANRNVAQAESPIIVKPGTFNLRDSKRLGLKTLPGKHTSLYRATDATGKFCHHPNLIVFKGRLYCMWSNGKVDEDAPGQRVVYRTTSDGENWDELQLLSLDPEGTEICVAAGFHVHRDQLVAYYTRTGGQNFHPETALMARTSSDGKSWSEPQKITSGFFIEGPRRLKSGRLILAGEWVGDARGTRRAKFLYTDDPSGLSGWKTATIPMPKPSVFGYTEPSFYINDQGTIVATLRNYSGYLYATTSRDGTSWTEPYPTSLADSTARTSAGNLSNGTAFLINNVSAHRFDRSHLAISLSQDGKTFDRALLVRDEPSNLRYDGKHKIDGWQYPNALEWKEKLFIAYSINKEDIAVTRVPVDKLPAALPTRPEPMLTVDGIDERHVMIPMRDGKRLSAYLYSPVGGKGPWPVIFEQRYGSLRGRSTRDAAARLAKHGYVVALINFRGTHLSEGKWVGYRALQWGKLQDGYDVCEWLAKQTWSTGKVGTFGSSQGGYAQNYLAVTQPPHLVCQYMTDTGLSLFEEGYRIGGATRPNRFKGMDGVCRDPVDNRELLAEWFRHPLYDDYWKAEDCKHHFDKMNVPCFTIGSWYDFMNQGSIASFQGRQHKGGAKSRGKQKLLIGPWLHGRLNKGNRVGELEYPSKAAWPVEEHMIRWFDHYLKGKSNGVERESAVRYFVMGAVGEQDAPGNVWREAKDFPPKHRYDSLYLRERGRLSKTKPTEAQSSTSYVSDPLAPMSIPGLGFPGARDARPFESQKEVRTFTTEPLAQPLEWTGRIKAELYIASTAKDTDFIVRVSDVYPDGRSILIVDYPWRARYRDGFEQESLLEPGKVHKVAFPVGWISQVFNKGHRIRVTIASTGAPLYEPNPQTGKPLTIEFPKDAIRATNTVYHQRDFASRVLVPIPVQRER